jgi:GT2 family glycosyltransferase
VFNTELKYNETERGNVIQVPSFIGCGVLHRKQFFIKTGMYSENIFLYVHEIEFSIRTLNKGYAIKYNPEAKIYHTYSKRNRLFKNHNTVDIKKQYYSNRNIIIVLLSHFSFHRVYGRVLRLFTGRILFGITKRSAYVILKGFSAGIWVVLKNWKYRQVVSNEVQKRYEYGKFAGGFFEAGQYAFKRPAWLRQRNS